MLLALSKYYLGELPCGDIFFLAGWRICLFRTIHLAQFIRKHIKQDAIHAAHNVLMAHSSCNIFSDEKQH